MRDATNASYYHLDKAYVNIISLLLLFTIQPYTYPNYFLATFVIVARGYRDHSRLFPSEESSWVIANMDGRTFPSRFVPRRFAVLLARRVTGPRRGITRLTQRLERLARNAGNRGDLVRVYQSFPPARERAPSIKTKLSTRVLSPIPDGESSILESKREPKDY